MDRGSVGYFSKEAKVAKVLLVSDKFSPVGSRFVFSLSIIFSQQWNDEKQKGKEKNGQHWKNFPLPSWLHRLSGRTTVSVIWACSLADKTATTTTGHKRHAPIDDICRWQRHTWADAAAAVVVFLEQNRIQKRAGIGITHRISWMPACLLAKCSSHTQSVFSAFSWYFYH